MHACSTAERGVSTRWPALQLEELNSLAALYALRDEWFELWERCPSATPFQSPQWLLTWWTHLGGGELCVLALRCEGRLVGLAPIFIHHWKGRQQISPLGIGISDYLDFLLETEFESAGARMIFEHLAEQRARWDVCDFQELRADSPLLNSLIPWPLQSSVFNQEGCVVLRLPPTLEAFQASLSKERRRKHRRAWKRLSAIGEIQFETANQQTLPAWMTTLFRLHGARWQERHEPGVLADDRIQQFHREVAAQFLPIGCLRLRALRCRDEIVAVLYGFASHGRAYAYLGGFDPELEHASPGTLLTAHAIEKSILEGLHEYDFLRGAEAHKYAWGARVRPHRRMMLWHATPPSELRESG